MDCQLELSAQWDGNIQSFLQSISVCCQGLFKCCHVFHQAVISVSWPLLKVHSDSRGHIETFLSEVKAVVSTLNPRH